MLKSKGTFLIPALAVGYAEPLFLSAELDLTRNTLVSSISGIIASFSIDIATGEGLQKLALLNTILGDDDEFWSKVKEIRRFMLLKTVLNWPSLAKRSQLSWVVSTEVLQLLRFLLPWGPMPGDIRETGFGLLGNSLQVKSLRLWF
jgi:hypothetical protein